MQLKKFSLYRQSLSSSSIDVDFAKANANVCVEVMEGQGAARMLKHSLLNRRVDRGAEMVVFKMLEMGPANYAGAAESCWMDRRL
jgi:hypothetical protein